MRLLSVLIACVLCSALGAHASSFEGVVSYVTDGDSLWVRAHPHEKSQQVRLHGIDAPEICQQHGTQARTALSAMVLHKAVVVEVVATDDYQRLVAKVYLAQDDVAAALVGAGHAWSPRYGQRRGPYDAQEQRARQARLGLWADAQPERPRAFRQRVPSCRN